MAPRGQAAPGEGAAAVGHRCTVSRQHSRCLPIGSPPMGKLCLRGDPRVCDLSAHFRFPCQGPDRCWTASRQRNSREFFPGGDVFWCNTSCGHWETPVAIVECNDQQPIFGRRCAMFVGVRAFVTAQRTEVERRDACIATFKTEELETSCCQFRGRQF